MSKLQISETFQSIQGESSFIGFPFFFIRFTGCNLRCSYCDTTYAYSGGHEITLSQLVKDVSESKFDKVLLTGGEPLLQESIYLLIEEILFLKKTLLLETNGSILTDKVNKKVIKIIDFKTPSSLMSHKNNFDNIKYISKHDEVKFVIESKSDFFWCLDLIKKFNINKKTKNIIFSPVFGKLSGSTLAEWVIENNLNIRVQVQLHKILNLK